MFLAGFVMALRPMDKALCGEQSKGRGSHLPVCRSPVAGAVAVQQHQGQVEVVATGASSPRQAGQEGVHGVREGDADGTAGCRVAVQ